MADDIRLAGVRFVTEDYANFRRTIRNANSDINDLNTSLKRLDTQSGTLNKKIGSVGTSFSRSRRDLLGWASDLSVVRFGIEALIRDITTLAELTVGTTASYESAFTGIAKTVDGLAEVSADGVLTLTDAGIELKDELKELNEVVPVTFEELSRYAELGGQLDILAGVEDAEEAQRILLDFTATIAGLNEATDIVGEDAAIKLSQIVNIYRDSIGDIEDVFGRIGSTVVDLGNNSATVESQILNMSRRVASAGNIAGLTVDEILALSAAVSSTGLTAEAGGTAISNGLQILNSALIGSTAAIQDNSDEIAEYEDKILDLNAKLVRLEYQTGETGQSLIDQKNAFLDAGGSVEDFGRTLGVARRQQLFRTQESINELTAELNRLRETNGQLIPITEDALEIFAETAGLTVDAFQELADTDASEAFTLFVEGLGRIDAEGGDVVKVLNSLGISSSEAERTFLGLAKSGSLLRDTFRRGNEAFEDNVALAEEIEKRYATLESQFQIFQNTLRNTIDDIFYGAIPTLVSLLNTSSEVVDIIGERLPSSLRLLKAALEPLEQIDLGVDFDPVDLTNLGFDNLDNFLKGLDVQPFVDFVTNAQLLKEAVSQDVTQSINDLKNAFQGLTETQTIQDFLTALGRLREESQIEIDFTKVITSIATFPIDTLTSTITLLTQVVELIEALNNQDTEGFNQAVDDIVDTLQNKLIRPFETLDIILPELNLSEKIKELFESVDIPEVDVSIPVLPSLEFAELPFFDFDPESLPSINFDELLLNIPTEIDKLSELADALINLKDAFVVFDSSVEPLQIFDNEEINNFLSRIVNQTSTEDVIEFVNQIKSVVEFLTRLNDIVPDISLGDATGTDLFNFIPDDIETRAITWSAAAEDLQAFLDLLSDLEPVQLQTSDLVIIPAPEDLDEFAIDLATELSQSILDAIVTVNNLQAQVITIADLIDLPDSKEWQTWATGIAFDAAQAIQDALNAITDPANLNISKFIEITGIDEFIQGLREALAGIDIFGLTPFESLAAPEIEDPDFQSTIEKFGEAPELMADSFEQGMDEAEPSFVQRTVETGTKIKEAILSTLGFQSPSQFFIDIGKDIIESIAIGISDLTPINSEFTNMVSGEVIPTVVEWDETNMILADNLESMVIPTIERTIQITEELRATIESADSSTRDWANTFTGTLVPALNAARTQLSLMETKTEDVIELVDVLTESYLALAAAITAANNAGTINNPTIAQPGEPSGSTPFQLGGSFIVPSSIPLNLRGATGGMNIEVHPGEFVQVIPSDTTQALMRMPTIESPVQRVSERSVSGQNISNIVDNSVATSSQELHLHVQEAPTSNIRDSFELMKILNGG